MSYKKKKNKTITLLFFIVGLILYLIGLLMLFGSSVYFDNNILKIVGAIIFLMGFILFMTAVVIVYRDNEVIKENNLNLIIEGRADVLTIILMTYIMTFMLVLCLLFNEVIGALLFGITIIIQSILNTILIKYYSKRR